MECYIVLTKINKNLMRCGYGQTLWEVAHRLVKSRHDSVLIAMLIAIQTATGTESCNNDPSIKRSISSNANRHEAQSPQVKKIHIIALTPKRHFLTQKPFSNQQTL